MQPLPLFPDLFTARSAALITQWLFFVLLGLSVLAIVVTEPAQVTSASALAGFLLALGVTLTVTITRTAPTPASPLFYIAPVLDGVAIAVMRLELDGGASVATLMAILVPATWLGTSRRRWSVLMALLLGALAVSGDLGRIIASPEMQDADLATLLMTPFVTAVAALFGYQLMKEVATASNSERHARRARDAIVDTVDVGMIVLDRSGTPIIVNRALQEHPVVRAEGQDPYSAVRSIPSFEADRITPHSPDREPLARAMTAEGLTDELFWARAHDGEESFAFLASSRRLVDEEGELEGTVIVFTDVTQYLDAVRSRDRLISSVSHELRTPLTVLRGFVELAREVHREDDDLGSYLEIIERNVTREYAIVDQLLLAAQSDGVRTASDPVMADLNTASRTAIETFRQEAHAKSIDLRWVADTRPVSVDPRLFRIIAEALIANAVRFTPREGVVTMDARAVNAGADGRERVRITVRDSGTGISAEDLKRIYDPFFRTEAAMRSGAPGVGLGLSVLKSILDSRRGTLTVESIPGEGTTVTAEFPVDEDTGGPAS